MQLTIVGATGGIGRHLVGQALAAGHAVTAAVRNPQNLDRDVPAVAVDLARPDPAALRSAVAGADAVLSCLGPRGKHEYGVVSTGTEAILAAMPAARLAVGPHFVDVARWKTSSVPAASSGRRCARRT
jgi:uncharacterized protein YbjT (DUF2867 family)